MKSLDLTGMPLEGTHLIEASAGTGKTYTIASLFIRLLLEKSLHVREILVVTYTRPATGELETRVREKIRAALQAFREGATEDSFLAGLLESFTDHPRAVRLLELALRRFDEAAIFTIHGFCARVLEEMAFETGSPFRTEMITDQADLLRQAAGDFYRMHFAHDMPLELVSYALHKKKYAFGKLLGLVSRASLDAEIIPAVERPDPGPAIEAYRSAVAELGLFWPRSRDEVGDILFNWKGLSRTSYSQKIVQRMLEGVEPFLESGGCGLPLSDDFCKLTAARIAASMNKGATPPDHPVFDLCGEIARRAGELVEVMERFLVWLKTDLFSSVRQELPARKDALGVMHYDDLLLKVRQALSSRNRDLLRLMASQRYKAALIDEFQDTDPIQYEIFSTLFSGSPLFLIGDPKQAIYSFRGADVFTYLNAARLVDEGARHTLDRNWRSEPGLIAAVNRVFLRDRPFVFHEIAFEPVEPAEAEGRKTLRDPGSAPLVVWFEAGDHGRPLNKAEANDKIARAVCREVSRLLEAGRAGEASLGDRGVAPRDIALIVRTNRQGRLLKAALAERGIPCVVYSDENVFDTDEAAEMEMLLRAVSEPGSADKIRAVLAGSLFGLDASAVARLSSDEEALEGWVEAFRDLHELWLGRGFVRMFRRLVSDYGVKPRLLERTRGERMLTNFLHLAEILGEAGLQGRLGMRGLVKWLSRRRDPAARRDEEHQLRLESDDDAVKIITSHKSKGLEFPIVFCPFLWGASKLRDRENVAFHDASRGFRACLDVGSDDHESNAEQALREVLAEDMRLVYVAMTRARNRCYVVWGRINEADASPLAYLFSRPPRAGESGEEAPRVPADPGADPMKTSLLPLCAGGDVAVHDIQDFLPPRYERPDPGEKAMACRELSRGIDLSWKVSSFTSLVAGAHAQGEADRDALYLAQPVPALSDAGAGQDIFAFPKGARAGTMIHEVFELLDFTDDKAVDGLVGEALEAHGFDPVWGPAVSGMVRRVLDAPLGGFSLSRIRAEDTLRELEFYLPVARLSPAVLGEAFALHGKGTVPEGFARALEELGFEESTGFLKGFIDLVFTWEGRYYLVDWKSNHLGNGPELYGSDALLDAMEKNHYILQAHIYSLALHRYLSRRVKGYSYGKSFGGVIYLFVRGVDRSAGEELGVYKMVPEQALIEHLSARLEDAGKDGEGEGHGRAAN